MKIGRKKKWSLVGGPWAGETLWLVTPKTLSFSVRGQIGHYAQSGERTLAWVDEA